MTLTGIPVGADHGGGLAGRSQAKTANLGEDVSRDGGPVFMDGRLDDRHQLALQGSVMPLRALAQTPHHIIRRVFDRD
jgi:hypothetical protein